MRFHKDAISGIVILILCFLGSLSVSTLPSPGEGELVGTASLPKAALFALAVCGAILVYRGIKQSKKDSSSRYNISTKALLFFLFYLFYMIVMTNLKGIIENISGTIIPVGTGFLIATVLFLLIALPILGRRKPVEILSVAVITGCVLTFTFAHFFQVLLP